MQLHCCALILTVVLGCIGTIEAGTRCRNPPILKRPDECCEFPQFDKEVAVIEKCVATHGAQAARLMADKTPGPGRGSVSNPLIISADDYKLNRTNPLPV